MTSMKFEVSRLLAERVTAKVKPHVFIEPQQEIHPGVQVVVVAPLFRAPIPQHSMGVRLVCLRSRVSDLTHNQSTL